MRKINSSDTHCLQVERDDDLHCDEDVEETERTVTVASCCEISHNMDSTTATASPLAVQHFAALPCCHSLNRKHCNVLISNCSI